MTPNFFCERQFVGSVAPTRKNLNTLGGMFLPASFSIARYTNRLLTPLYRLTPCSVPLGQSRVRVANPHFRFTELTALQIEPWMVDVQLSNQGYIPDPRRQTPGSIYLSWLLPARALPLFRISAPEPQFTVLQSKAC